MGQALAQAGVISSRKPVITKGTFPGAAILFATVDHAERAVDDAITAAVADIRLNIDRIEFGADDRAGRTAFQAPRARAMLTDVGRKQPRKRARASCVCSGTGRSMKATCRHVDAPKWTVLSYDIPVKRKPSSGNWFHCLHATSHALQPMQSVVSVKKPLAAATLHCSLLCFRAALLHVGWHRLDAGPQANRALLHRWDRFLTGTAGDAPRLRLLRRPVRSFR